MKKLITFLLFALIAAGAFLLLERTSDRASSTYVLRGINLGGWLSDELRYGQDRFECDKPGVYEQLRENLGVEEADRVIAVYHDSFITAADFDEIVSNGFNAVRIPVSASHMLERSDETARFDRIADRLAWAVEEAANRGLSVILNVRVRAGDWAPQPSVRGRRFKALWTERDVESVAGLWGRLAARFKDAAAVEGYDLSPGSCLAEADKIAAFTAWHNAIREHDQQTTVIAPWPRPALDILTQGGQTNPAGHGFAAVNMEHAMASEERAAEIRQFLENDVPRMERYWQAAGMACMVTEYNPAVIDPVGLDWVGTYREEFARLGWHAMFWTWKSIIFMEEDRKPNASWLMGVAGISLPDFRKVGRDEADAFFAHLAEVEFVPNETLREKLERSGAAYEQLAVGDTADSGWLPGDGWQVAGIGGVESRVTEAGDDGFTLLSSGTGIEGFSHEMGYVFQQADGRVNMSAMLKSVSLPAAGAGAGLMVRLSTDSRSPYLLVTRKADGSIVALVDNANGQPVLRRVLAKSGGYDYLRLSTDGKVLKASCSADGRSWPVAANFTLPWITNRVQVGPTVFSGHEYRTAKATFSRVTFSSVTP